MGHSQPAFRELPPTATAAGEGISGRCGAEPRIRTTWRKFPNQSAFCAARIPRIEWVRLLRRTLGERPIDNFDAGARLIIPDPPLIQAWRTPLPGIGGARFTTGRKRCQDGL